MVAAQPSPKLAGRHGAWPLIRMCRAVNRGAANEMRIGNDELTRPGHDHVVRLRRQGRPAISVTERRTWCTLRQVAASGAASILITYASHDVILASKESGTAGQRFESEAALWHTYVEQGRMSPDIWPAGPRPADARGAQPGPREMPHTRSSWTLPSRTAHTCRWVPGLACRRAGTQTGRISVQPYCGYTDAGGGGMWRRP